MLPRWLGILVFLLALFIIVWIYHIFVLPPEEKPIEKSKIDKEGKVIHTEKPSKQITKSSKKYGKSEGECREILESMFPGYKFDRIRPKWLRNPETNRPLELDCYNEELKLALEYNGIQHYKWPNFTKQSRNDFIQQIRRDTYKVGACNENGVYLIIVPWNVSNKLFKSFIHEHLPQDLKAIAKLI